MRDFKKECPKCGWLLYFAEPENRNGKGECPTCGTVFELYKDYGVSTYDKLLDERTI